MMTTGFKVLQSISKPKLMSEHFRKGVESLLEGQPLSRRLKTPSRYKEAKCQPVFVPTSEFVSTGPMSVLRPKRLHCQFLRSSS